MNLPPFDVFPELKSENLVLREVKTEDIPNLLEVLTYDGKRAETLEDGIEITDQINADYTNGDSVNWVMQIRITKQLLGVIGYCRGFQNETGEIGCILKSEFRGQGYMSEALRSVIQFGLNNLKLRKITAITGVDNIKAIALLTRNGFINEKKTGDSQLKFGYSPLQSTI